MICNKCRNQMPDNAKFCNRCGAPAVPPQQNNAYRQNNAPQQPNNAYRQNNAPQQPNNAYRQNNAPQQPNNTYRQNNAYRPNNAQFGKPAAAAAATAKTGKGLIIAIAIAAPVFLVVVLIIAVIAFGDTGSSAPVSSPSTPVYEATSGQTEQTGETQAPQTTQAVTQPAAAYPIEIQMNQSEKDWLYEDMSSIFIAWLDDYDCNTISVGDAFNKYVLRMYAGSLIARYFPSSNQSFSTETNPDPLGRFPRNEYTKYSVYSKDKVDWLIINVLNVRESKEKSASVDDYLKADSNNVYYHEYVYYHDGNFYIREDPFGIEGDSFEIDRVVQISDNRYTVYARETYWDPDSTKPTTVGHYTLTVDKKQLNGSTHWTLYKATKTS
ncbi:MAG: zinc-ribbon domain-containing protein [Clostridia bacterium]|nr:zinc-ribbon domain-containing protein [Clostridia bacterium]